MDVVVTAGGIPQPGDRLYAYTQGIPKAMLDIHGKPMAQWVLDALGAARLVDNVILIGLTADSGLTCEKPLYSPPNRPSMIENVLGGIHKVLEVNPSAIQVLMSTSDIPA